VVMSSSGLLEKLLVVEEQLLHLADKAAGNYIITLTTSDASDMKSTPLQSCLPAQSFS
jgi:hypothetical protein